MKSEGAAQPKFCIEPPRLPRVDQVSLHPPLEPARALPDPLAKRSRRLLPCGRCEDGRPPAPSRHAEAEVGAPLWRLRHNTAPANADDAKGVSAHFIWIWQIIAAIAVGLIIGGFSVLPHATIAALSGIIAVPFLCVTLLRVVALREVIASPRKEMRRQRPGIASLPQTLPHYTVMVPLLAGWARRYLRCTHMGSAMLLDS
jgi:hypothetical protein